jgi:DNA invertase Pin-like site-specific DNA recombinase
MAPLKNLLEKLVALYVRLSRDDENEGDSNSIAYQIAILAKYCKDRGITNYKIYKDDGFPGTNFNRPGFKEMLADIEAGLVGTVIVKDMSRFGRNYLEVGLYTEIRFPEMGVRFIAINDGVDSDDLMDNDFTPFRNIINEWYAKDTSKKIRAVFRNKGMSGQRLSGVPPYGYIKGESGQLLIDEETAPVVKMIFQLCVEGNGTGKIARILQEREIPTPGTIRFQRAGLTGKYHPDAPCSWRNETISGILAQDAYLGRTTNFKTYKPSFKSKRTVFNPPEKRVTFENTHPAIIDLDTWEIVQKNRAQRRRPMKCDIVDKFSGLVVCYDCGQRLYHSWEASRPHEQESYICGTYRKRGKPCTAHFIRVVVLETLVLQNLQRIVAYAQEDEDEFVRRVMENKLAVQRTEQEQSKRKLEKQQRRITELDAIIQKLYEDNVKGKLTDERFAKLSATYEAEQAELERSTESLQNIVEAAEMQSVNIKSFLKIVKKYTEPTELTPQLLHEFVDKIVVHEADKSSGHRIQRIDIHYNFIGEIDFSPEYCGKKE